jgi:hypothetical protein
VSCAIGLLIPSLAPADGAALTWAAPDTVYAGYALDRLVPRPDVDLPFLSVEVDAKMISALCQR